MNGGKVVYVGEHTPWPSYVAVTRERGYPESRRYYQRETCSVEEVMSGTGYVEFQCSACGCNRIDRHDSYCPNCGARVVE